jgi:hypothetical protein
MLSAFLLEPFRIKGINKTNYWKFDSPFRNHTYLSRGLYSQQLRNLYSVIPERQVLVLHQQELKNQHNRVMTRIFEFLNITDHNIASEQVFVSDKTTGRKSNILARLYAKLYFFIHKENAKQWSKITTEFSLQSKPTKP